MSLHINEKEVRLVLSMAVALEAVEESLKRQGNGEVVVQPRRRFELPSGGFYHYMAAADYTAGFIGEKQYTYVAGKIRFLVMLYEMATGNLVAQIEGDYLGRFRTGAASGVATKYLARADATVAAIIGTGGQARTQLEAIAGVRKLTEARVFGRDAARRLRFAEEMGQKLGLAVHAASSVSEAMEGADVVCPATTATQPVIASADVRDGMHVNAIGANHAHKREMDAEAVAKAGVIVTDSLEQARQEAGDLILAFVGDEERWSKVARLADVVAGKSAGRAYEEQITLFKSNGIASWDLALGMRVFELARQKGLGRELPLWKDT
jgi:ornithine cyclodeaminase/alanine dehydrogenase-like protein (mu-crystallin family)